MTTKIHKSHLALLKLIERSGNNCCADCGCPGTRWASWNLGIFLCIRCAGIHRNLGVHISKVKSVDLDSWTAEQMQSMELMGNKKSQEIYEAALPVIFMRPQTNYAVEEFIRAKYQHKRYCTSKETPIAKITDGPEECIKKKNKDSDLQNNLVHFEVSDEKKSVAESDDSLSDPEYLSQQKQYSKSCHKVHSESDLISFNSTLNSSNKHDLMNLDSKNTILSLYNRPDTSQSYQSSGHASTNSCQRSYGSSSDAAYYSTTNIPIDSQSSYLRQIQDKLTNLKVNLTSKFRQYEQPPNDSSFQSNLSSNGCQREETGSKPGHTLSPDLWR